MKSLVLVVAFVVSHMDGTLGQFFAFQNPFASSGASQSYSGQSYSSPSSFGQSYYNAPTSAPSVATQAPLTQAPAPPATQVPSPQPAATPVPVAQPPATQAPPSQAGQSTTRSSVTGITSPPTNPTFTPPPFSGFSTLSSQTPVNTAVTPASCADAPFNLQLSRNVATIGCDLNYYADIGITIQTTCAQLPLFECDFLVYYANGTDPGNFIGGPGDEYGSADYGPCPFQDLGSNDQVNENTTFVCPTNTQNAVNEPYYHVLTSQYILVDNSTNEIYLAPQLLVFDPPLSSPFLFVPSPDDTQGFINQYYTVQCYDANFKYSNVQTFQVIFPFCR